MKTDLVTVQAAAAPDGDDAMSLDVLSNEFKQTSI